MGIGGGGASLSAGDGGGGGRRQELHGHEKAITCLAVSSDSSVLVSGSEDGTVRTWHVASRQCVQKIDAPGKGGKYKLVHWLNPNLLGRKFPCNTDQTVA